MMKREAEEKERVMKREKDEKRETELELENFILQVLLLRLNQNPSTSPC